MGFSKKKIISFPVKNFHNLCSDSSRVVCHQEKINLDIDDGKSELKAFEKLLSSEKNKINRGNAI